MTLYKEPNQVKFNLTLYENVSFNRQIDFFFLILIAILFTVPLNRCLPNFLVTI
jgi:hypothetical protein